MLAFMGTWPLWAIYSVVGAVLGCVGGLFGGLLSKGGKRKYAAVITFAAIACSKQVTEAFILPRIAQDAANKDLPKKVDDMTVLERINLDGKVLQYYFKLDDKVPLLSGEQAKAAILPNICPHWKTGFDGQSYNAAEYHYQFKDGTAFFTVTKADCI